MHWNSLSVDKWYLISYLPLSRLLIFLNTRQQGNPSQSLWPTPPLLHFTHFIHSSYTQYHPVNQLVVQSVSVSVSQSQSVSVSVSQNQSVSQCISQSVRVSQSASQSVSQPVSQSASQSVRVSQSVSQSASQPTRLLLIHHQPSFTSPFLTLTCSTTECWFQIVHTQVRKKKNPHSEGLQNFYSI